MFEPPDARACSSSMAPTFSVDPPLERSSASLIARSSLFCRLPPLLVAVFINIAGFSLILPLLPFYGQVFGAGPVGIALLFAAYSFGNVFGEIHWGRQSDVWGRRKVFAITTFVAGLSYFAFAYAPSLGVAILIRR